MAFRINGKNLSITRLIPRGKNGESRLKYLHVSTKGTAVIDKHVVARVTLPEETISTGTPMLLTQDQLGTLGHIPAESTELVELPQGRPAITGPEYLVPKIDNLIPDPDEQSASFTVNAEVLLKVLKVACEVTDDADKTIRLRICPEKKCLRIDAFRQPGKQEFVAVVRSIEYGGGNIPGDKSSDAPPVEEVPPVQGTLMLKASSGRRFRG